MGFRSECRILSIGQVKARLNEPIAFPRPTAPPGGTPAASGQFQARPWLPVWVLRITFPRELRGNN